MQGSLATLNASSQCEISSRGRQQKRQCNQLGLPDQSEKRRNADDGKRGTINLQIQNKFSNNSFENVPNLFDVWHPFEILPDNKETRRQILGEKS